jgi:membrane associated rhomboid family serine protease
MKRPEFFLIVLAAAMIPTSAMAYLDPVTGSIVWQMAVGGFLAAAATMRLYWSKLRAFFSKKRGGHDPHGP